ncbi:hypothetical protein XENTR_v10019248 [Xenopus tropicalis]|uniref:Carcinoembryonic antigen-related cell adhesion molecule 1 n=1 Tax=Xenopus tropicalis TaxID=8364 RepID=A0A8J0QZ02_XENTR|nr:carcinoembryonic antigen-related cell adhesion molecule 1 [Xenopus tropicalis]KAE8593656.1 hypothetical protein XENTR_v10019248 [Xenopus tropicalis]|eukprot:XP_002942507.1 PREDICTED: carcinoembryonic antigen-related cell adhesion molecule 1-like [Xenopus tropicalis]
MARERVTATRALCMRGYLLTALFSVWINLIYGIKIQAIPKYPVVNKPVTLSVSGVSGAIRSFSWYSSSAIWNSSLILSYNPTSNPVETQGPKYFPRASSFSNGSLRISKLFTTDRGYYTVQIQAESSTQETINLPVYVPLAKPTIKIASRRPMKYEEVTLSCDSDTSREIQRYSWSRINGPFPSGVKFWENNRTMTIPRIIPSDVGQYQCETENPVSKNISEPYTLSLYCVCVEPCSCTGVCVAIVGSVLILSAIILLLMRNKYVSVQTTGQANRHDGTAHNHNGTRGQNTTEGPSYPEYSTVDSGYTGLQDRPNQTYSDLNIGGTRHG